MAGIAGSGCLMLAAGASFDTRQFPNSFSIVKLDLLSGIRCVQVIRYDPRNATYSQVSSDEFQIEVTPIAICGVSELASGIMAYNPTLAPFAFYLAALILGKKTEIPIPINQSSHTFGSFDAMQSLGDVDLKRKTNQLMTFRNVLRVMYNRESLTDILTRHGDLIGEYGEVLTKECQIDSMLQERLEELNEDARSLDSTEPQGQFPHSLDMLEDLATSQEWTLLRQQAERFVGVSDPKIASQAKRMMALALANSDELSNRSEALRLYGALAECELAEFSDIGNLAILFMSIDCAKDAGDTVLKGIQMFPEKATYFEEIGQRVVGATGDRELRLRIEGALGGQA